jgi:hypothetical protein
MKRSLVVMVGLTLILATSASAGNWGRSHNRRQNHREVRPPVSSPIPEPTAALVFGTALLVIGISKRRHSDR